MSSPQLELRDSRPEGRTGAAFRRAWMFKGDALERAREIIEGEGPGLIVHACCGASPRIIGAEIRVDLHHPSADYKMDVCDLALVLKGCAVVFMDPPYGLPVQDRQRMISACLRALRPGGLFILHAPWWPRFKGANLELGPLHGPFFREDYSVGWPHPPVILSCWRKKGVRIEAGGASDGK